MGRFVEADKNEIGSFREETLFATLKFLCSRCGKGTFLGRKSVQRTKNKVPREPCGVTSGRVLKYPL